MHVLIRHSNGDLILHPVLGAHHTIVDCGWKQPDNPAMRWEKLDISALRLNCGSGKDVWIPMSKAEAESCITALFEKGKLDLRKYEAHWVE